MTATLSVEPRRSQASLKAGRELPVLFHLIDVSRPRALARTLSSADDDAPVEESPAHVGQAQPALPQARVEQAPAPASPLPPPVVEPAVELPIAPPVSQAMPEIKPLIMSDAAVPAAASEASLPSTDDLFEQAPVEEADTAAAAHAAEAELPAGPPTQVAPAQVTPATPAKTTNSSAWFAVHGKYIAITFVIALIGTIYFARTSRRGGPPVADHNHAHPGEASLQVATVASSQATVVGEAKPDDAESAGVASAPEVSPAQLAVPQPQTDLHPPTIPQLESPKLAEDGPAAPADPSLFPWAREDERVAARPEAPASSGTQAGTPAPEASSPDPSIAPQYPTTPNPGLTPEQSHPAPQSTQYPSTQYPSAQYPSTQYSADQSPAAPYPTTQYPTTQYPTTQYPTTQSPAAQYPPAAGANAPAYPSTNTPQQYTFPPAPGAGASAPAGPTLNGPALTPPAGGSQYIPQDNSARGSRYERTGSGLY
jgi:hypothetical protein